MAGPSPVLRVGTRTSALALLQTRGVIARLAELFPDAGFEEVGVSTPGDRDLKLDLRESPPDFFTRDLDEQLLAGRIDIAVHSAKDLPDPMPAGVDWCWLPWREDSRDVLVVPRGARFDALPAAARIGVSSDRRQDYCHRRFPGAQLVPIRGNIQERLQQLDEGRYDLLVMAGAALNRLGLQDRIAEWIPADELAPPDGQGVLAMTFREGDARLLRMRSLFVKAVTFAGAGVGSAGTCTLDGLAAVQRCDVCIHDELLGAALLERLPPAALRLDVGKRCGRHGAPQEEITRLIALHARRGARVVRLKGGDPGIFGRLAEEVEALDRLRLPYRVLPGVTSLTAAAASTGMLLTRRGVSRGFCAMTPRAEGGAIARVSREERARLPIVFFMALTVAREVTDQLMGDGVAPDTPAAVIYGAGGDQCRVLSAPLSHIAQQVAEAGGDQPGLLFVGDVARYRFGRDWGALRGWRVLLTASEALQEEAAALVTDLGGVPVCRPLIRMVPVPDAMAGLRRMADFDWVVLTSPSAARCFGEQVRQAGADVRAIRTLVSCGDGTSRALRALGLRPDIAPASDFGAAGLMAAAAARVVPGLRVLRLRSDKAGPGLAEALRARGAVVEDCVLYRNEPVAHGAMPEFEAAFFASASAVEAFDALWGTARLARKTVAALGKPTVAALEKLGVAAGVVGPEATVGSCLDALAAWCVREAMDRGMPVSGNGSTSTESGTGCRVRQPRGRSSTTTSIRLP